MPLLVALVALLLVVPAASQAVADPSLAATQAVADPSLAASQAAASSLRLGGRRICNNPAWPAYLRGKGQYAWATSRIQRQNGVTYQGAALRLRRVLQRMMNGEAVHVTAMGGSITAGHVQRDGLPWPTYVFNYLQDHFSDKVAGTNAAVGGSRTPYMSVCHQLHVPSDSDLILFEYSLNDGPSQILSDNFKRAQERLIRRLLSYPNKPAIIFAHVLPWTSQEGGQNWHLTAEPAYNELSQYYAIPQVSLRSCCFQDLLANKPGFNTTYRVPAGVTQQEIDERAGVSFFYDGSHLDGLTGARVLAELVMHVITSVSQGLKRRPILPDEVAIVASEVLPPPMFANNTLTLGDRCFVGTAFKDMVVKAEGFEWIDEAKGSQKRFGMIATKPGATLQVQIDTTAPSLKPSDEVVVLIAHLNSYKGMGALEITCLGGSPSTQQGSSPPTQPGSDQDAGCRCQPTLVQGHWDKISSQVGMHRMAVTQSKHCMLLLTVLNSTLSGGYKAKITGAVVSEETLHNYMVDSNRATAFD